MRKGIVRKYVQRNEKTSNQAEIKELENKFNSKGMRNRLNKATNKPNN